MKDYRITHESGELTFAEIFKHKPCFEEFLNLLTEYDDPITIEDFEDADEDSVLIRNLDWLIDKGLLKKPVFEPITIRLTIKSKEELLALKTALDLSQSPSTENCRQIVNNHVNIYMRNCY